MTQDDDALVARACLFRVAPAQRHRHAKHRKVISCGELDPESLRAIALVEAFRVRQCADKVHEYGVQFAIGHQVAIRQLMRLREERTRITDRDELLGVRQIRRPQEVGVDEAEDRAVETNA